MAPNVSTFVSQFIHQSASLPKKALRWHRYHKNSLPKSRQIQEVKAEAKEAKGKLFEELAAEHYMPVEAHNDQLAVYALKAAGCPWSTIYVHPQGNPIFFSKLRRTEDALCTTKHQD